MKIQEEILKRINQMIEKQGSAVIGIDGRCASGKSHFGRWLQEQTHGTLIHMDDFFLRPEQRTPERYAAPGENVDHERFLSEVLLPLSRREPFTYHPFDCSTMSLKEGIKVPVSLVTIIEGSYAMRKDLRDYYDLKIFMTVSPEVQIKRIRKRDPEKVQDFEKKWIPFEEKYFSASRVDQVCDIVIDTTDMF